LFSSRSFLLLLAGWAVMGWMPTFLQEQFKVDQGAASISETNFLAVAMFVGKLVRGVLGDAQINVSTLFQCAAGGLLVCGVLVVMAMVQPSRPVLEKIVILIRRAQRLQWQGSRAARY
jgi:sugar phosphate permease